MGTKTIRIAGEEFQVNQPYAEGPWTLTAAEARTLNQTRAENVGNNTRKAITDAKTAGTLDAYRNEFAKYEAEYTFATPGTGGARQVRDPIEREARSIARELLSKKLAGETPARKLKDVDAEKLEAAIEQIVAREDVQKLAKNRVSQKAKASDAILADLSAAV